ncbi:MAG: tetratricopeptide repeat protein, partial [Planctomycetes bacterium]|nr:tetratricopeptide repeat protein [Planctomycetota bacterium]
ASYRLLEAAGEEGLVHVLSNLADALAFANRLEDAEPTAREAVQRALVTLGPEHRVTARARAVLADVLRRTDRAAEARVLYEVSLATTQGVAGLERSHAMTQSAYGMCLLDLHEHDAAATQLRAAADFLDPPTGPPTGEGVTARITLARALHERGEEADALIQIERALVALDPDTNPTDPMVVLAKELRDAIVAADR